MCGIVGYVGKNKRAQKVLIDGLKELAYRGYDSAGIAYIKNNELIITKEKGKIVNLEKILEANESNLGIGHTRWATNGEADQVNSHPHKQGKITIVHNGIIENAKFLRPELESMGYIFKTKENDTEVAAAILDKLYNDKKDINKTLVEFQKQVEGAYALGIVIDDDYNNLYAIRKDSPLIIALGDNENYIASDVPAIIKYTNKYMELDNGDFAKISANKIQCFNKDGMEIEKEIKEFPIEDYDTSKHGYEHIMLKEIHEQPTVVKETIAPYIENGIDSLIKNMPDFSKYDKIVVTACGSAMHAGLVGKYMIEEFADIPVDVEIASEFRYKKVFIDDKTLVIGVSQSGETADTLKALEKAKEKGADTLGIISKKGSSIARYVDCVLYTNSGIEVAVATTKAYSAQVALLSLIAFNIANHKNNIKLDEIKEIMLAIKELPIQMEKLLSKEYCKQYKEIASNLYKQNDIFYIGRGIDYALCMEGSLKLKEISYIHSEAYAAGELKHGTISLIEPPKYETDLLTGELLKDKNGQLIMKEPGTPVIGVTTDNVSIAEKTFSNLEETRSRGSQNYMITTTELNKHFSKDKNYNKFYTKIVIPTTHKILQPLLTVIPLQLIAYETAKFKGEEIDTPRNLAKSVTVE